MLGCFVFIGEKENNRYQGVEELMSAPTITYSTILEFWDKERYLQMDNWKESRIISAKILPYQCMYNYFD